MQKVHQVPRPCAEDGVADRSWRGPRRRRPRIPTCGHTRGSGAVHPLRSLGNASATRPRGQPRGIARGKGGGGSSRGTLCGTQPCGQTARCSEKSRSRFQARLPGGRRGSGLLGAAPGAAAAGWRPAPGHPRLGPLITCHGEAPRVHRCASTDNKNRITEVTVVVKS